MQDRAISHIELQKKNYRLGYRSFSENKKYYSRKVYRLIKKQNRKFSKLLDVGCGDGGFAVVLKREFNLEAHGIDISSALKDALKKGIKAKKHDVTKKFPYKNNFFDLVVSIEVIEHIYDTDFFLSEINRILKKKGRFFLTTPNLASLQNRVLLLFGKYPSLVPEYHAKGPGHIRSYTVPVLKKQLKKHGFRVLKATSANFPFPMEDKSIPKSFKNIAMHLGDFFPEFGSHMVIMATK